MKASVKLYKSDGLGKLGYPIKLILSHKRQTRRKTFGFSFLEDWDPLKEIPRASHEDFEDLYPYILEMRKKAIKMEFLQLEDLALGFNYMLGEGKPQNLDFYAFADARIEYMKGMGRHGNARAYDGAINQLKAFLPDLDFLDLTNENLESFKEWQKSKGNKNSTVKNYLVEIRAIYNAAVKKKLVEDARPFAGVFADIPVQKRRQRNRYLPEVEIEKLKKAGFSQASFQRAVDLSLLQFYLCGVDFVDLYYLKKENLLKKRVILTRLKLGAKAYEFDVMLPDAAKEIILKYQAKDGPWVFPWHKDPTRYKTFIHNHRRSLKKVKDLLEISLAPKDDTLSPKVLRHTFATLGKYKRIEEDLLRELMGHERNDIDTVYKDKYPEAERNAAQMDIIGL